MYHESLLKRSVEFGDFSPTAKCIWHPSHRMYFEPPINGFCFFVKDITLTEIPEKAVFKLFADSRYMAFINGAYLARGPCRSDPRYQYYDVLPLDENLIIGKNTIGVMAVHFGYGTGQSIPRVHSVCGEIVLTYGNGRIERVDTDESWLCLDADCYKPYGPRINGRQCAMEIFDANEYPDGWNLPDYHRDGWANAVQILGRVTNPFFTLHERVIPMLEERAISCEGITAEGRVPIVHQDNLVTLLENDIKNLNYFSTDKKSLPFNASSDKNIDGAILIKFDKVYAGYFKLDVDGGKDTIIDVIYSEHLVDNKPDFDIYNRPADRFILKEGKNSFEVAFGWKAFQYALLIIRGNATVLSAEIISRRYPLKCVERFACSDDKLMKILDIGEHTLRLCMQDGFLDSSSREQQQWIGDGRWQALVAYRLSSDSRLQKNLLEQIGQSQNWTGMIKPRHPDAHDNLQPIPSFALAWVSAFNDYVLYTGDLSIVKDWWINLIFLMRWFTAYENDAGLLTDVPHWYFLDWGRAPRISDTQRGGIIGMLNLMYLEALISMEKLALLVNDEELPAFYKNKADKLKSAIMEKMWDEENGVYVDSLFCDGFGTTASEPTNAMALLMLHDKKDIRVQSILENVFIKRDVGSKVFVPSSPYMQGYTYAALKKYNKSEIALDLIIKNYKTMIDAGSTTTWEQWDIEQRRPDGTLELQSASHGWGSIPILFGSETILGIEPIKNGYSLFDFSPNLLSLSEASGEVPTPFGEIRVKLEWKKADTQIKASIVAPSGTRFLYNGNVYDSGSYEFEIGGF